MEQFVRDILGYLNFSGGNADPRFQANLNRLMESVSGFDQVHAHLTEALDALSRTEAAFRDADQARAVLELTFENFLPAYGEHHRDLLFHLDFAVFEQPFFLARVFEAVICQGAPFNDGERIVQAALDQLNDYLGYRPVAVLENGRQMQPYAHEQYRPIPLYVKDAGVAVGPYQALIERTLDFLKRTPEDLLGEAWFDVSRMDELALDVRSHDHGHPVNKRTNYMFGEWDPHRIDTKGFYRRFVVRQIILDALLDWLDDHQDVPLDDRLDDAATVLGGTILMASSISGAGPQTYDSTVSLASLLPRVARQRDAYYLRWIEDADGPRRERLLQFADLTRQPFGHVRQQLNMFVARYGSRQVQHRHLAWLYARMGYEAAAREEAAVIPALSVRFETELQLLLTTASRQLDAADLSGVDSILTEVEDLLERGIDCGALIDPWNILAFQGQFPLFSAREDAIPDNRAEVLLDLMEQTFGVFSRAVGEAAAQGQADLRTEISERYRQLSDRWDRYATVAVEELPHVAGVEMWESSRQVANALEQWNRAGSESGDIAFWRERVETFQSPRAFSLVVEALLVKGDHVAAMGLLMQWLSEAERTGLDTGQYSIHAMLIRWMTLVTGELEPAEAWPTVCRMFDYLEANAGSFWNAPTLREFTVLLGASLDDELPPRPSDLDADLDPFLDDDPDEEDAGLFGAAYDGVVFRDSADDGQAGETLDSGYAPGTTEFEIINRQIEPRLSFLQTLFRLWQMAATTMVQQAESIDRLSSGDQDVLRAWQKRTHELQEGLIELLRETWSHEMNVDTGDLDSNIEYDIQLQARNLLLHSIITTTISCVQAQRLLGCLVPPEADGKQETGSAEQAVSLLYSAIVRRDRRAVKRQLQILLDSIAERPLLYVPFENGGQPARVLRAKSLQSVIRFLLAQLPKMGLLRETLDVLRAAFQMERSSRPAGFAVTEFDRLFRIGLESSLACLIQAWGRKSRPGDPKQLAEYTAELVEHYAHLWTLHSNTMRLSTVEELRDEELADDLRQFIEKYGGDLFHTRMLTLGNVRTVLHQGMETFLDFLEEESDPLRPIRLIDDLHEGKLDSQDAMDNIEIVYEAVVDRFDRFLEYNTTTTQSDYGEKFFCFLDFLRVESAYDRDAWTFAPMRIAHECLVRHDEVEAARMWEQDMRGNTAEIAEGHLTELTRLEKELGMRLPSMRDRISERFVKPLVVNRMLALVPRAMARTEAAAAAFDGLRSEVTAYLEDTFGSGIDVPQWLQALEHEVTKTERGANSVTDARRDELALELPIVRPRFSDLVRQLEQLAESEPDPGPRVTARRRRRRRGRDQNKDQK